MAGERIGLLLTGMSANSGLPSQKSDEKCALLGSYAESISRSVKLAAEVTYTVK